MITWITENVAIGEYLDGCNREALVKEKIDCVLSLRMLSDITQNEPLLCKSLNIRFVHIPVGITWEENPNGIKVELRTAAYMLEQLTEKYKRILVHCTAGIDRAPFVVAYYIKDIFDWALDVETGLIFKMRCAYEFIKKKRPQIMEHMEWI